MMRTVALLCACTLAMRKDFDAQRHVFVYDVPALQAYVSGDQRNIPGTEKNVDRNRTGQVSLTRRSSYCLCFATLTIPLQ